MTYVWPGASTKIISQIGLSSESVTCRFSKCRCSAQLEKSEKYSRWGAAPNTAHRHLSFRNHRNQRFFATERGFKSPSTGSDAPASRDILYCCELFFPLQSLGSPRGGNPRKMGKNYKIPLPVRHPKIGKNYRKITKNTPKMLR